MNFEELRAFTSRKDKKLDPKAGILQTQSPVSQKTKSCNETHDISSYSKQIVSRKNAISNHMKKRPATITFKRLNLSSRTDANHIISRKKRKLETPSQIQNKIFKSKKQFNFENGHALNSASKNSMSLKKSAP